MNILRSICPCLFPKDGVSTTMQYAKLPTSNGVSLDITESWDGDEFDDFDENWDQMESQSQKKGTPDLVDGRSKVHSYDDNNTRNEIVTNNRSPSVPEMRYGSSQPLATSSSVAPTLSPPPADKAAAPQPEVDFFAGMTPSYKEPTRVKAVRKTALPSPDAEDIGSALYNLETVIGESQPSGWGEDIELNIDEIQTDDNDATTAAFDLPKNKGMKRARSKKKEALVVESLSVDDGDDLDAGQPL